MLKKIFISSLILFAYNAIAQTSPDASSFGVGIRPSNAEFIFEPGKSIRHHIDVQNVSNIQSVKLVLSAVDWDLDKNNKLVLLEPEKAKDSAVSWINFRPNTMMLNPTQTQKAIIDINVPVDVEEKEYRAALLFSTVLPSQEERVKHKGVWNRWQVASLMYFTPKLKKDNKSPIIKNVKINKVEDYSFKKNDLVGKLFIENLEKQHLRLVVDSKLFDLNNKLVSEHNNSFVVLSNRDLTIDYSVVLNKDIEIGNYILKQKIVNIFSPSYEANQTETIKEIEQKITPANFFNKGK